MSVGIVICAINFIKTFPCPFRANNEREKYIGKCKILFKINDLKKVGRDKKNECGQVLIQRISRKIEE